MNMKRILIALAFLAAAFMPLEAVHAQTPVPTHVFFVEGSAGLGSLLYQAEGKNSILCPGYGGGFGYTWHITPALGITTGAQLYVFNGGLSLEGISYQGIGHYHEDLTDVTVLVPLMLQFMAPAGEKGHRFYAALGGKAGIHAHAVYIAGGDGLNAGSDGHYDTFDLTGEIPQERFFPAASAEAGFRWALKGGNGLYTGLYADYGFISRKDQAEHYTGIPVADSRTRALGAGIKVKFAFGKVR